MLSSSIAVFSSFFFFSVYAHFFEFPHLTWSVSSLRAE